MPLAPRELSELFESVSTESVPDLRFNQNLPQSADLVADVRPPEGQVVCADAEQGAGEVFRRIEDRLLTDDVAIVALGGPSRSGKGFITEALSRLAAGKNIGIATIPMDWFYLLKEQRAELQQLINREVTFDDPESLWLERLQRTMQALKCGENNPLFPNYLYESQGPDRLWQRHTSLPTQKKKVFVIDGIFAGHPASGMPDVADVRVHMTADGATQVSRRIQADTERGRNTTDAADTFLKIVPLKRNLHIDPFECAADVIVHNTMPPGELMQRVPRTNELKLLFPGKGDGGVGDLIREMRKRFIETKVSDYVDAYVPVNGRASRDFARLRFSQGKKGIRHTSLMLSLHGNAGENYKSEYDLYPGAEHVTPYVRGLMACFRAETIVAVMRRRTEFVCGNARVHLDTDSSAWRLDGGNVMMREGTIVAPHEKTGLLSQMEAVGFSANEFNAIAGAVQGAVSTFFNEKRNTFEIAKDALRPVS